MIQSMITLIICQSYNVALLNDAQVENNLFCTTTKMAAKHHCGRTLIRIERIAMQHCQTFEVRS